MEGHLVGGRGLRPPDGDAFVEDDDVDEEVLVEKPDDEVRELLGPGQLRPDHRLSDVDDDDDVHRVNVELGQGRRSVVEVGEEGVLGDHVGLSVEVDVVLQRQVAGEALVAEGVELKVGNDQLYIFVNPFSPTMLSALPREGSTDNKSGPCLAIPEQSG